MNVTTLLGLAQNAVDVGNVPAACEFYEVALQMSPNNDVVLEAYAEIMMHFVRDAGRAEQMLRHAVALNPNEGHVKYLNLAQLCSGHEALALYGTAYTIAQRELGRSRKKKQQKAIRRTLSTIRCAAAELYLTDLCDEPNAEEECEKSIDDANFYCNDSVEVHQLRGSFRLSQKRCEEAAESLRIAVDLTHRLGEEYQPTYESKVELGKLLMQVAPGEAFRFLLEVLQLDATNPYVWFLLGEASRLRQRYADAARLFKHARLMVSPTNAEAIHEIDSAILLLVSEMGGEAAVNSIPHMDAPNPLDHLQPEDEEEGDNDDGEAVDDEAQWEAASTDSEDEARNS